MVEGFTPLLVINTNRQKIIKNTDYLKHKQPVLSNFYTILHPMTTEYTFSLS